MDSSAIERTMGEFEISEKTSPLNMDDVVAVDQGKKKESSDASESKEPAADVGGDEGNDGATNETVFVKSPVEAKDEEEDELVESDHSAQTSPDRQGVSPAEKPITSNAFSQFVEEFRKQNAKTPSPQIPDDVESLSSLDTGRSSSEQRQDCLAFDLNVAEDEEHQVTDTALTSLPVHPSERLNWDLNCVMDPPSEEEYLHPLSTKLSSSSSSLLSLASQPALMSIDLNEPSPGSDLPAADHHLYLGEPSLNLNLSTDDCPFSFFGVRLEDKPKARSVDSDSLANLYNQCMMGGPSTLALACNNGEDVPEIPFTVNLGDFASSCPMIEGGKTNSVGGLRMFMACGGGDADVVGGRRKEPDSGFEPSPFSYKHHQPSAF